MTKKYSRAQRRADYARIKDKRQFHWGYGHKKGWGRESPRGEICFMAPQQAGLIASTSTPCSCWMCGNPRKTLADDSMLTIQERKAVDSHAAGLEEYDLWMTDWYYEYREDDSHYDVMDNNIFVNWKWAKARGWA